MLVPQALTVKQVKEAYNLSRYTLLKFADNGFLKIHRPNGKQMLFLRDEIENAIRMSEG